MMIALNLSGAFYTISFLYLRSSRADSPENFGTLFIRIKIIINIDEVDKSIGYL